MSAVIVTEQNNAFLICDETVRMPPGEYTHAQVNAWLEGEWERLRTRVSFKMHARKGPDGREFLCACDRPERDHSRRIRSSR